MKIGHARTFGFQKIGHAEISGFSPTFDYWECPAGVIRRFVVGGVPLIKMHGDVVVAGGTVISRRGRINLPHLEGFEWNWHLEVKA